MGLASIPLPCGELQQLLWEQCGGPCCIPPSSAPLVGCWWGCPAERGCLSPTGAVPAQELAQKLEKQERTTLKLQKQLRAYTKQIQEFTGKLPAQEGGVGLAGGSLASTWGAESPPQTEMLETICLA